MSKRFKPRFNVPLIGQKPVAKKKIFVAQPRYGNQCNYEQSRMVWKAQQKNPLMDTYSLASSFLTFNFNYLWCYVLNHTEYSHFVMIHEDIVPKSEDWLDKLMILSHATDADILSVVSPIKNLLGTTSTALAPKGEFGTFRRLTMADLPKLPETFSKKDACKYFEVDPETTNLLTNTGLMVVNLAKRDVFTADPAMCFDVSNWIRKTSGGEYYPVSEPEDWKFSREAQERGLSVWATRAIAIRHVGEGDYDNDKVWGVRENDKGDEVRSPD